MEKKPMTKAEMVAEIAAAAGINKTQAQAVLGALVEACRSEVKAGRPFRVAGLGTFAMAKSKARKGVNPATGEPIKIAAKKRMVFKPGTAVKELLNPTKK